MDYEFTNNLFDGSPEAKVDDPQAAFGSWLTHEIGADKSRIERILAALRAEQTHWQEQGREWLLELTEGDVVLAHHSMTSTDDVPLSGEDELRDDHENLSAEAGLEDFCALLTAWFHHISS